MDEHLSGPVVGKALAAEGHDVRDVGSEALLASAADGILFEVADSEGRVTVTANVRDFLPLAARWTGGGREHVGLILIPASIRNEDFGNLVAGLRSVLAGRSQQAWRNEVYWLQKRRP